MVGKFRKDTATVNHQALTNIRQDAPSSSASDTINGLLSLAGFASDQAKSYMDKQVEEDTIKQMHRVSNFQLPTDDATRGGYRAAAMLGLKMERSKSQASLELIAKDPETTDELFQKAVIDENNRVRDVLKEKYAYASEDTQVNKVAAMSAIDDIPRLTAMREATRLKAEEAQRLTDFGDFITLQRNASPEDFETMFSVMSEDLKISEPKARALLVDRAIESGDADFMERVSNMSIRDVPISDTEPKLMAAMKSKKAEDARMDAGEMADQRLALQDKVLSGDMSGKQVNEFVAQRNRETGGAFMTATQLVNFRNAMDERVSKETQKAERADKILTGKRVQGNKAELQQGADAALAQAYQDELAKLPEEERDSPEAQSVAQMAAITRTVEQAGKAGVYIESLKGRLKSIARSNPDLIVNPENDQLTPTAQAEMDVWSSIPDALKSEYAKGDEASLLNAYSSYRKGGATGGQALRQAQLAEKSLPFQNEGDLFDASKKAVNKVFTQWFDGNDAIPSVQRAAIQAQAQEYMRNNFKYDPSGSDAIEGVKGWLEANFTQQADGRVFMGNVTDLGARMQLSADKVPQAMQWALENRTDVIEKKLEWVGGSQKDVYWQFQQDTGRAILMSSHGFPIEGVSVSPEEIKKEYRNRSAKEESEKRTKLHAEAKATQEARAKYTRSLVPKQDTKEEDSSDSFKYSPYGLYLFKTLFQ